MKRLLVSSRRYRLIRAIKKLSGLQVYYPLSEVEGTNVLNYAPATLGANNGTTATLTQGTGGRVGRAYTFNGTSSGVAFTSPFTRTAGQGASLFAISQTGTGGSRTIAGVRNGSGAGQIWKLGQTGTNLIQFEYDTTGSGGVAPSAVAETSAVHFSAGSYDGLNIITYQDGVQVGILTGKPSAAITVTVGGIGKRADTAAEFWAGPLQHVGILNRALTAGEHRKLAHIAGFI